MTDCPSVVTSPRHVHRPSVFAFSYVPDNVYHTTLFPDPFCTLSVLEGDSYCDSLSMFLWVVTSFSSWVLLSDQVSELYFITGSIHLLNAFLFTYWHIFVSHDVVQLTECTPSVFDSPFHFLYLVMVFTPYSSSA